MPKYKIYNIPDNYYVGVLITNVHANTLLTSSFILHIVKNKLGILLCPEIVSSLYRRARGGTFSPSQWDKNTYIGSDVWICEFNIPSAYKKDLEKYITKNPHEFIIIEGDYNGKL